MGSATTHHNASQSDQGVAKTIADMRSQGNKIPVPVQIWLAYLAIGALNNALPFPLIFWDQTQIDSSLASILNATTAILPVVIACLSLADYALTTKEINGATLSLIGVV